MNTPLSFQDRVRKGLPLCGTHVNLTDSAVSELEAQIGFDYLLIDLEHTAITLETLHNHLLACRAGGTAAVVRVPADDLTVTKRVLEMGVDGVIFPMVTGEEHARTLLSWTLYPPYGARGCGPKGAIRYGLDDERAYYQRAHIDRTCRFVMIETESAALEAEKIAALPYLDGCVMGMFDLSGSLGDTGNIFSERNLSLATAAVAAFRRAGKSAAISTYACDGETLQRYHGMGINMITAGADFDYIRRGASDTLNRVRTMQAR